MNRTNGVALACAATAVLMVGAAFASVPLYRIFCQVTGFNGTVSRAEQAPTTVLDETLLIRFDTNVRDLPMQFRAEQVAQRVQVGDTGLAYFDVTNTSDQPIHATAAYNVVPERAGPYFQKLQCFCFDSQTIAPGETQKFAVQYFVAPEIATDREGRGVREITLSYTFFPTKGEQTASLASATGAAG
ncbi:cytochrome c oxidase assembly protein [uncultured Brevundimonas sp.]|uniref:cytochrome c oxidase assembly protein n=1 Tax=uncultured Brevundimonas sp. TaxID=213418 RepID=UPI0030EDE6B7